MTDLRYISLGAGVQSSTMYLLACRGEIGPRPDVAIFADTQAEPRYVYEHLDYLGEVGDIPIHRVTAGSLLENVKRGANTTGGRFASVPFWVESAGGSAPGQRQCTREYKIDPIKRHVRELLGVAKGERIGKRTAEEWIGISTDEASRAKPSRYAWITTRWPLLFDRPMSRGACLAWLEANGYRVPLKSACTFCPYRSTAEHRLLKEHDPEGFEEACRVDEAIRPGTRGMQYVHRSLTPLRELDLTDPHEDQLDLWDNECEGMCGV